MANYRRVACECGTWTGVRCEWSGAVNETIGVEFVSEDRRQQHINARRNNKLDAWDSVRLRMEMSCADLLLSDEEDGQWARPVEA